MFILDGKIKTTLGKGDIDCGSLKYDLDEISRLVWFKDETRSTVTTSLNVSVIFLTQTFLKIRIALQV